MFPQVVGKDPTNQDFTQAPYPAMGLTLEKARRFAVTFKAHAAVGAVNPLHTAFGAEAPHGAVVARAVLRAAAFKVVP